TTLDKSFDGSWRVTAMASFSLIRDDAEYLHSTATTPRHFGKSGSILQHDAPGGVMTDRPRVAVIGTGGTISSLGQNSTDVLDYPDTVPSSPRRKCSRAIQRSRTSPNLFRCRIRASAARPSVLLSGSKLLASSTASHESSQRFRVLSSRMGPRRRPESALSSDAGMNLLGAIRTASASAARGLGVLVVLNDEIQAAREVTKTFQISATDLPLPRFRRTRPRGW